MAIQDYDDDDDLDRMVFRVLIRHWGKANAVKRWELVAQICGEEAAAVQSDENSHDRRIRKSKERLRRQGHIICDLGDGSGCFMAATEEEYQAFRSAYGSHAFPILETIREMDKAAQRQWPNAMQPRLL